MEYQRRHKELWPELKTLLKNSGIQDYSIFLDEETNILFSYLKIEDEQLLHQLAGHKVMQTWWKYMENIMETNEDTSPHSILLNEVFYLE